MKTFVEYKYHPDMFSQLEWRDIRLVAAFDVQSVAVPEAAIGFTFIKARTLHGAKKRDLDGVPTYYLGSPADLMATADVHKHSGLFPLFGDMLLELTEDSKALPHEAYDYATSFLNDDMIEHTRTTAAELLKDEKFKKSAHDMAEFAIEMMEQEGCHRILGAWPLRYTHVLDKDIVLDRTTREVISPALTGPGL